MATAQTLAWGGRSGADGSSVDYKLKEQPRRSRSHPEHDAIRRNRLIVESCSALETLERVRTAKVIPLLLNAL
jgi:hypothetical protein